MAAPKTTTWKADPHTIAKHAILKAYLNAWFQILTKWHGRVVYYDGFAGPGRYAGGEDGSPVIALKAARDLRLTAEVVFIFVEEDEARAQHLRDTEIPQLGLPSNFKCEVINGEFEPALRSLLDRLDQSRAKLAPTFALIDPFGIDGLPFELIARLLHHERSEVLITFMKSAVNRFVEVLGPHTNTLIGNPRAAELIAGATDRLLMARQLYAQSLHDTARFVRYFEMRDEHDVPIYDLFFATNHALGHTKMKEAMWKVDASGAFGFSDGVDPLQAVLFREEHGARLANELLHVFGPRLVEWQSVDVLKEHVRNHTTLIDKHATEALKLLEANAIAGPYRMEVAERKSDGEARRRMTFPDGTMVRFVSRPS